MIIGINGFKGSGKDTVGTYLRAVYGFHTASFATKLKESAAAVFGIEPSYWETYKNNPDARVRLRVDGYDTVDISAREFLQRYGTEAHRDVFGSDFWVDQLLDNIAEYPRVAIPDARFTNELEAIRTRGGVNIQVKRPGAEGEGHRSEVAPHQSLIDFVINNDFDLRHLYQRVDEIMDDLGFGVAGL